MKHPTKKLAFGLLTGLTLLFASCSSENNARLEVRLTDSPGDYEEVNIDIQEVKINSGEDNSGWVSLDIEEGVYNILDFTNGLDTLLGAIELPPGEISQIRLVLGSNNSVKINGVVHPLSTPSAQQSGLKLNLHATLVEGITYRILLDFDAARSVVVRGNHTYSLKPVIRAIEEATSGAIKGAVVPTESTPAVYAIAGSDTVATAFADEESGKFMLRGLDEGTYTVAFSPKEGYLAKDTTGISVTLGTVTELGTVKIGQ